MNHTNRKYLAPVTAFGVAISLVTLVYIASAQTTSSSQHGSMQMMGDMHSDTPLIFSEALELSDEPIKQLRELQLSYAHSLVDAQAAIRKAELDVQAARTQPGVLRNLEQVLRAAAEARIELELLQARQAEGINRVLTPDQREKWSSLSNGGGCNVSCCGPLLTPLFHSW